MLPSRVRRETQRHDTRGVTERSIGHDRHTAPCHDPCRQNVAEHARTSFPARVDDQDVARLDRFDRLALGIPLRFALEHREQVSSGREIAERTCSTDEPHTRHDRPDVLQELVPESPAVELCPECRGAHSRQLLS